MNESLAYAPESTETVAAAQYKPLLGQSNLETSILSTAAQSRRTAELDHLMSKVWRAYAESLLDEAACERIANAVQARKAAIATTVEFARIQRQKPAAYKPCRSLDPDKSTERRRRLAASRNIPDTIRQSYPTGELAVLAIVAALHRERQICVLPVDALAARAGVCRTTVKNALRHAAMLGHLERKERRIPGAKSLTNIVRITSLEWTAYLRWQTIGVRKVTTTETPIKTKGGPLPKTAPKEPSGEPEKAFAELTTAQKADRLRALITWRSG